MQKLGVGAYFRVQLCSYVYLSCAEWIGMVGLCFGSLVQCLCAWISARTCKSRSGEL